MYRNAEYYVAWCDLAIKCYGTKIPFGSKSKISWYISHHQVGLPKSKIDTSIVISSIDLPVYGWACLWHHVKIFVVWTFVFTLVVRYLQCFFALRIDWNEYHIPHDICVDWSTSIIKIKQKNEEKESSNKKKKNAIRSFDWCEKDKQIQFLNKKKKSPHDFVSNS